MVDLMECHLPDNRWKISFCLYFSLSLSSIQINILRDLSEALALRIYFMICSRAMQVYTRSMPQLGSQECHVHI